MPETSTPNTDWDENFLLRSPMFSSLSVIRCRLNSKGWPKLSDYNQLLASLKRPPRSTSGALLRCVEPVLNTRNFEQRYEPAVYLRGELQTRENNWHDLFNLLIWSAFPLTKAAINECHFVAQQQANATSKNRSAEQDAMRLFDESGVIVACALPELGAMLKNFKWKQLFWHHRSEVIANMRFYVFGHGLLEKALLPYPGMTGKVIIVPVDTVFLSAALSVQIESLDLTLATSFLTRDKPISSTALTPLPLLGVPGWTPDNEVESYYDDTRYFRLIKPRPASS